MPEYIFFMHNDAVSDDDAGWESYLRGLNQRGVFAGGSEIGGGECVRQGKPAPPVTAHLAGYIRVTAANIAEAKSLVSGNPHFAAGGTVEIRELPRSWANRRSSLRVKFPFGGCQTALAVLG